MTEAFDTYIDALCESDEEDRGEEYELRFIHRPHLRLMTGRDWVAAETREENER